MKATHHLLLTCLFFFVQSIAFSQDNKIQGFIADAKTSERVPFAHVFIKNTTIGGYADIDGNFSFIIPESISKEQILVVSHTSYERWENPISSTSSEILLNPKVDQLKEVVVTAPDYKKWKKNLEVFKKEFLGYSNNSRLCDFLNPDVLRFKEEDGVLKASAGDPLKIKNKVLGYEITYYLDAFEFNLKTRSVQYSGSYFAEDLDLKRQKPSKKWKKNRKFAYQGSFPHFVNSVLAREFKQEGFDVNDEDLINLQIKDDGIYIQLSEALSVTYKNEYESLDYQKWADLPIMTNNIKKHQLSVVKPLDGYIHVNFKNYIMNPNRVMLQGYMGWERIADFVPENYQPEDS